MFSQSAARACIVAALLFIGSSSTAQDFAELEQRLRDHPSLIQLEHEAVASLERATAASALPDPEVFIGINNVPISNPSFDRYLPSNKAIGIMQKFPSRSGREARSAQLRTQAEQLDALRQARFDELRGQLIVDLIHLERIRAQRELAEARNDRYDALADVVNSELDAGRPALFRLAEIEAERAEVARLLVELDAEAAQRRASLVEKVGPVTEYRAPPQTLTTWSKDPMQFHAVRIASVAAAAAERGLDEAKAAWKSNWGVHLTYQQRSSGAGGPASSFDGDDWFSAGVNFSVPLWGQRRQAPNVRAAEAQRASANLHTASLARSSIAAYEALLAEKQAAENSQRVLSGKIGAIRAEILAQQSRYESGEGDYAPIIDGEIAILTVRAHIAQLSARALIATAHINALMVMP